MLLLNVLPVVLAVFLLASVISTDNAYAQREDTLRRCLNGLSGVQDIQGERRTPQDPPFDLRSETGELSPRYSNPPWPGRFTLLPSGLQCCLGADSNVFAIDNTAPGSKPVGIYNAQRSLNNESRVEKSTFGSGEGKSYLIPAIEIPAFNLALNGVARLIYPHDIENGRKVYKTTPSSLWHNLAHGAWGIDTDDFITNQIRHPYQGSIYQGSARSAGLNFWESAAYTFSGSFLWEVGGETTSPSINDMVATGIGGTFLGESLFRMASHILETGEKSFWREVGAAVISPPTGFNRHVFGDRFKSVFPSYGAATFSQGSVGVNWVFHTSGGNSDDFGRNGGTANFVMMYGLPGKPGYNYTRPFDYFEFEMTAISNRVNPFDPVENLTTRGILVGTDYGEGNSYRGLWGLYGSYDYIAPGNSFRVSTTALSLGTTGQWWLSRSVALQGSALAGLGYGAGGSAPSVGDRDYHYGLTGQGLISLRLLMGDIAMLEATLREYYISDTASSTPQGRENIGHLDTGLTVRLSGRHAVGIRYLLSDRVGDYAGRPTQRQKMETFALVYTILSDTRFGAVEWRETR